MSKGLWAYLRIEDDNLFWFLRICVISIPFEMQEHSVIITYTKCIPWPYLDNSVFLLFFLKLSCWILCDWFAKYWIW